MFNKVLSKLIVTNAKTGIPSYTLTAFIVGIFVINLKLLLSDITIFNMKMSTFTGVDYSAAIAALGSIYIGGKHFKPKKEET